LALASAALLTFCASAASAATVFAEYQLTPAANNDLKWTKVGSGKTATGSLSGDASGLVDFSFLSSTGLNHFFNLKSLISFSGSSDGPAVQTGSTIDQPIDDGTFDITYDGNKTSIGGHAISNGEVLLSGTFADADLTGSGLSWALDSVAGVTYSSPFVSFTDPAANSFALEIIPNKTPDFKKGDVLGSFNATSTGSFEGTLAVPEPASWSMLIFGFGLVGGALRMRARDARQAS